MVEPYPKEVREKAITLRKQGLQYKEIRQRLREEFKVDIAEMTLNRWFLKAGLVKEYRSLEERLKIAKIVKELRQQGLGYKKIQRRLMEMGYGYVDQSWIDYTLRGITTPDGSIKKISTRGYEFGYVVGALLSDGYIYRYISHRYACILTTKDVKFRDKFVDCARKIGLHARYYNKESKLWEIKVFSKMLYDLLKTGRWRSMMGPEEIRGFLDGYFDGDGNGLMPSFANTNREMLEYIRKLLEGCGVRTSPPILIIKAGTVLSNEVKANHNIYIVYIHPYDYGKFTEVVKTCIPRKQHLIELSKKIIEEDHRPDYISGDGWWEVCIKLQKAVGRSMIKSRRKG